MLRKWPCCNGSGRKVTVAGEEYLREDLLQQVLMAIVMRRAASFFVLVPVERSLHGRSQLFRQVLN